MPTTSSNSINPKRSRFDEPTLAALVGFKDKRAVIKAAYQRRRTNPELGTVGQLNGGGFHVPLYMEEGLEPKFINPENDLVWYWSSRTLGTKTPPTPPPPPGIVTVKEDQQHTVDPLEFFSDPYHVLGYRKPLRLKRKESIQEPTTSDTDSDSDKNTTAMITFAGGADRRNRHNHGHGKNKKPYTKGMHIPQPLYSHC